MSLIPKVVPVVLCGGAGTRLWPLSRKAYPKQFAVELDHRSLLDLTLERARGLAGVEDCMAVTAEDYRFMVTEALDRAGLPGSILLEPVARNTAPAICAAALTIAGDSAGGGDGDPAVRSFRPGWCGVRGGHRQGRAAGSARAGG